MNTIRGNYWRRAVVRLLSQRDGWSCHYCMTNMEDWYTEEFSAIHIDHKDSRLPDRFDPDNLVLACSECNEDKGDTPYQQFIDKRLLRAAGAVLLTMSDREIEETVMYALRYAAMETWGIEV